VLSVASKTRPSRGTSTVTESEPTAENVRLFIASTPTIMRSQNAKRSGIRRADVGPFWPVLSKTPLSRTTGVLFDARRARRTSAWLIKQRLCQFARRRTCGVLRSLLTPDGSGIVHFSRKAKRPREQPAQAPVRTTSRTPSRHCTPMVQRCTGNYHGSVAVRSASQAMVI
jgi:hypothetical protein